MNNKRKHFLALSLAGIGAIGAFSSVSASQVESGTSTKMRDQVHTEIKQAFTSGDYQTYLLAIKNLKTGVPILTEAQFGVMIQAEKLKAQGDVAGAKKLLDDAQIKPLMRGHDKGGRHGEGKGEMTNLTDAQKATLVQARDLFKAGKQDEAKALLTSTGITIPSARLTRSTSTPSIGSTIKGWFKKLPHTNTTQ